MDEIILGQKLTDRQAMTLAMQLARKGLGFVSPNPAVGCVILDNKSCLLSQGYHEIYGGPHAEVNALKGLSAEQLQGARVFVTLEPCAHYGKTPPCAEALAQLPLAEVIFGLFDPNPLVRGQGAERIKAAGIKATHYNQDQEALESVCEHFLKNMRFELPFVSIKCATSIDGKLALKNGQSQWITGPEAREQGHFLRAIHDGILVGVETFLTDNPSLDIRHPQFSEKKNRVLILDPKGRGLEQLQSSKLLQKHQPQHLLWIVDSKTDISLLESLGVPWLQVPTLSQSPFLDLHALKSQLWKKGLRSLLVEGGANTISAFINQKAADRLYLFMAPMIIGESSGLGWASQLYPIESLAQSTSLSPFEISSVGKDLLLSARFL